MHEDGMTLDIKDHWVSVVQSHVENIYINDNQDKTFNHLWFNQEYIIIEEEESV